MDEVRVAIAGYGRFGSRQASIVDDHPKARLVGVADPDEAALRRAAERHAGAATATDPAALLDAERPDALLVVSAEDTHADITRAALERGVHVFCEKPLATSVAEAAELADMAARGGLVYQAGYILRYEPRHVLLREQTAAGDFGEIARLRAKRHCSQAWFRAYGYRIHPVYETLVHDIDLAVWLTGRRCQRVTGFERRFLGESTPETFLAVCEFDGGAIAVLETSWLVPEGAPANIVGWGEGGGEGDGVIDADLEVVGTRRSANLRTYEPSLTITTPTRTYIPDVSFWPTIGGRALGALREELWDFLARVAGDPGLGVASIDDALHVQAIADAAVRSGSTGEPVEVDR